MKPLRLPAILTALLTAGILPTAGHAGPVLNPREFGAAADGKTNDSAAIQRAIDLAAPGGGTVLLENGVFLSGTLQLKSGVTLRIEKGATLLGSPEHADYRKNRWLALLEARDAREITLTGGGIIDGQGALLAANVVRLMEAGKLSDAPGSRRPSEQNRPQLLEFVNCDGVTVRDLTLKNSACWVQTYINCDGLILERLTVESTAYWNNDGLDLMDCRHVLVSHCAINSADDGICLKSGQSDRACEDIRIENCKIRSSASALKFGTTSRGAFRRITVRGLEIFDTYRSAIAIESVDGAVIEEVDISGVEARNTGNAVFIRIGQRHPEIPPGKIRNVRIENVNVQIPATAPDAGYPFAGPPVRTPHNLIPSSITGLPGHPVESVTLKNITITSAAGGRPGVARVPLENLSLVPELPERYPEFSMFGELPAWGVFVRHGKNLVLENVVFRALQADFRPALVFDDLENVSLNRVRIEPPGGGPGIVTRGVGRLTVLNPPPGAAKPSIREIPAEPAPAKSAGQ